MQDTKKDLKEAMEQDTQQEQGREQEREPDFWDEMDQILKDKELSKGPSPFPPTEGLDLEKISYEIRMKARKRAWKRWGSRVACFVLLAFVVVGVVQLWETPAEAGEDNIVDKIEVTDDPIQGYEKQGKDVEETRKEYITTDESEIAQYRDVYEDLCIPDYIPEEYSFSIFSLIIYQKSGTMVEYQYKHDSSFLLIYQASNSDMIGGIGFNSVVNKEKVENGTIYYISNSSDDIKTIYFISDDNDLSLMVYASLDYDELKKIYEGLN